MDEAGVRNFTGLLAAHAAPDNRGIRIFHRSVRNCSWYGHVAALSEVPLKDTAG